ncbi:MAG: hypothetical protein AAB954_01115 [Patescibacteria group bacterium]
MTKLVRFGEQYCRTVIREEPIKTVARLLLNSTYFSYLSSSYLFAPISHFEYSLRRQLTRPQKAFFKEIYYFQNARKTDEVDFIILDNGQPQELIQVCSDLSDCETQRREFGALLRIGAKLGCKNLKIITASETEKISLPTPIKAVSLADFFLSQQRDG